MIITLHNTDKEDIHTMTLEHFIKEFNEGRLPDELFIIKEICEPRDAKIQKYIDSDGSKCPFCGSNQIQAGHCDTHKSNAYQEVECLKCRSFWENKYKLDDIVIWQDTTIQRE